MILETSLTVLKINENLVNVSNKSNELISQAISKEIKTLLTSPSYRSTAHCRTRPTIARLAAAAAAVAARQHTSQTR